MGKKNRIILIGNGFDLAMGLKTSYEDFIKVKKNCISTDVHGKIKNKELNGVTTTSAQGNIYEQTSNKVISKSNFLKRIIENIASEKWADIEKTYYFSLLEHVSKMEHYNEKMMQANLGLSRESVSEIERTQNINKSYLQDLNIILAIIVKYLKEYLEEQQNKKIESLPNYNDLFFQNQDDIDNIYFINFNYTNTLNQIQGIQQENIIHIHGKIDDEGHPMIFGYGDEMDENYKKIVNLDDNELLEHIKSINYAKTAHYQYLINILEFKKFEVFTFGMSCGLSDRVLLNTIFEHKNCEKIKIFYRGTPNQNNHKEITMNMSRHFKDPNLFRKRLVPKSESQAMPQYKEQTENIKEFQ